MALISHSSGGYRFLPGISPYSCGVISDAGFEIVHVTLHEPVELFNEGFARIEQFLDSERRPRSALCGIELRCARPYSFEGFSAFNSTYQEVLQDWGLFESGINPLARTNVAPMIDPPSAQCLYGFSFTRMCQQTAAPTFIVSGAGELPEGLLSRNGIVELGNTAPHGIEAKARFVWSLMENRLLGLGMSWRRVTATNVYTRHPIDRLMSMDFFGRMNNAKHHGVTWHYSMPPIEEIEFEMDLRGTCCNLVID